MREVENPMINYKETEPKTVGWCCNCNQELTEQDTFLDFQGEYLCDEDCLFKYYDIRVVGGWEI
jgi:hypothetical protein